eukprot:CAMPEP_0195290020 /NCGR_PEP_ID=MMETSP0707-20130614/6053_1 /TAXON_ID=33640 /ORGANISM="Asterionellopsis glacialis, Strain CCMP134" /LENGTH=262 /DNA_ID=CAMNT_0040350087 /DNA_START=134 /DNA_END=919 /DNA_ORIENTATION=+
MSRMKQPLHISMVALSFVCISCFTKALQLHKTRPPLFFPKLGFHHPQDVTTAETKPVQNQRRDFLTSWLAITATSFTAAPSFATPIQYKTIRFFWDDVPTGSFPIAINGQTNTKGSTIQLSYQIPEAWDINGNNKNNYNRITIYQKTGTASVSRLEKALELGIPRALDIGDRIGYGLKQNLKNANLVSSNQYAVTLTAGADGQPQKEQTYFQYHLMTPAAATTTSSNDDSTTSDDTTHYLFSTTIMNDRLYVFILQCNELQW